MVAVNVGVTKLLALAVAVYVLSIVSTTRAAPTCQPDHYLDHGTGHCEHCCDVCCQAEIKKTEDECQRLCPAYAKQKKISSGPLPSPEREETTAESWPSAGGLAGIIAGAVVVITVIGAVSFIAVRKVKQTRQQQQQRNVRQEETEPRVPLNRPYVGVEEEGHPDPCQPDNSWHIMQSFCHSLTPQLQNPYQESGQQGRHEMALPLSNSQTSSMDDDEEVTPKTILSPIYRPSGYMLPSTLI